MLYNLAAYLKTLVSGISFATGGLTSVSPDECIVIIDNGGTPRHDVDRTDCLIQFLARYESLPASRVQIHKVYDALKNLFHVQLPAASVDGVTYPAIMAWQISPIQAPAYIGTDDGGRHMYSVNFLVTIGGQA